MSLTTLLLLELLPAVLPLLLGKGFSRTKWHHDCGAWDRNDAAAEGGASDHIGFMTHACRGSIEDTDAAALAKAKHHVSL
jgi:hypothetical protein